MSAKGKLDAVPPRKRTARACAHCRRRKSKCDGHEPCNQCSVIGLLCSYEVVIKPETGLRYVAKLERKIESLERTILDLEEGRASSVNSASTGTGSVFSSSAVPPLAVDRSWSSSPATSTGFISPAPPQFVAQTLSPAVGYPFTSDSYLDTIEFDVRSAHAFASVPHGTAAGLAVLNLTFSRCEQASGSTGYNPSRLIEALDCPVPVQLSRTANFDSPFLPPKQELLDCVNVAFAEAFYLWPFLDRSHLDPQIHRLYNTQMFGQSKVDWDHLALIYTILALGKRFDPRDSSPQPIMPGRVPEIKGLDWIQAARAIVEPNACHRSLAALQAVLCMAIFLSSCKALTQCAEFLAHASTAAIRMGLHESLHSVEYPEEERVLRQRTYVALRTLDSYVSSILGLPRNLRTVGGSDGICVDPTATDCESFAASDAYLELRELIGDAEENFYFNGQMVKGRRSYSVPYSKIQSLNANLEQWYRSRSDYAARTAPSNEYTRAQLHLRYAFGHAQMVIYFPFLHYASQANTQDNPAAMECCRRCLKGAMTAVQTAEMLDSLGMFNEAYPLTLQVLAFAATALLVVEMSTGDPDLVHRAQKGSRRARSLLAKLSMFSVAAAQLLSSLQGMYNKAGYNSQNGVANSPPDQQFPKMDPYSNLWAYADFEGPS